ncbi:hypothetical protein D3C71_1582360 [compost metagenome]
MARWLARAGVDVNGVAERVALQFAVAARGDGLVPGGRTAGPAATWADVCDGGAGDPQRVFTQHCRAPSPELEVVYAAADRVAGLRAGEPGPVVPDSPS